MAQRRRRPTSADVAHRAGVSRTTVSFVLTGRAGVSIPSATRERVESAARDLGYHAHGPARQLAGGRSQTIGFVLRQSAEQVASDALLAETIHGLAATARSGGYRVLIEPLAPSEGTYSELLRSHRTDGLVLSGPRSDDAELATLVEDGFPIVLQGSRPDLEVQSVDVDNRAAARHAVRHLIDLGHRQIACITNAPLAYTAAAERLAGYRDALDAAGIGFDERLVAEGSFDAGSGHLAAAKLLDRTSFTALFVASDVVALGALRGIREAGLEVPRDLSVVGFDDVALAEHFDPPLTTVRLPARALGETAGRILLDRLAGHIVASRTILPTELIVRESTGPISMERASGPGGAM
ncbi:MAG TPA: LacI family DNA-binding transcriptional regulator [Candidatus Limnocylindria bacterium]|nr:LacI family DNA-binding transcriptional regulator [Candidatus Limnocylindria bacterium]